MPNMIFASVGSMLPFDRLARAVDEWAEANPARPVFIQIGDGAYQPRYAEWARIVPHKTYVERLATCDLFVAHVGIGSIIQALEAGKQMLMLPRRASIGEHTNDHQLHTAARFMDTPGLEFADDETSLQEKMTALLNRPAAASAVITPFAPADMCNRISQFLGTAVI